MLHTIRWLCWATVIFAIGWSAIAIGHGKTGQFFGNDVFIAATADMMVALVANILAAVCVLFLLATRRKGTL